MSAPFSDYPDTLNTSLRPPPYAPALNGVPAESSTPKDDEFEEPPPAYPDSRPPSSHMLNTATIFTTGNSRPIRNRMVRTVNPDEQIVDVYPGFAFCKFPIGQIETFARLSVMVMLLVLIILSGVAIREEGRVVTDGFLTVDATGWRAVAAWIIFVSSVAIVLEATMLIVRYLNPSCINNNYGACGGLDTTKCALVGIGLFIGCIITAAESTLAASDFDEHCNENPYNADKNKACRHLQGIYRLVVAVTTINALCLLLLVLLASWDVLFIYNGLNSKVPVPRARDQVNQSAGTD